jgi:hypothetical protein
LHEGWYFCYVCQREGKTLEGLVRHIVKRHADQESVLREFGINFKALVIHNHLDKLVNLCNDKRAEREEKSVRAAPSNIPSLIGKRSVKERSNSLSKLEPALTRSKTSKLGRKKKE